MLQGRAGRDPPRERSIPSSIRDLNDIDMRISRTPGDRALHSTRLLGKQG